MSFGAWAVIVITVLFAAWCANDYAKALRRGASEHNIRAVLFWYLVMWLGNCGAILFGNRPPLNQHSYTHWFYAFGIAFTTTCVGRIRANIPPRPPRPRRW